MVSSLPPPPAFVDPNLVIESANQAANRGQKAYDAAKAEQEDDDMDGVEASGSNSIIKAEVNTMKGEALQWWQNDVEIATHARKDDRYGWADVAGKSSLNQGAIRPVTDLIR